MADTSAIASVIKKEIPLVRQEIQFRFFRINITDSAVFNTAVTAGIIAREYSSVFSPQRSKPMPFV